MGVEDELLGAPKRRQDLNVNPTFESPALNIPPPPPAKEAFPNKEFQISTPKAPKSSMASVNLGKGDTASVKGLRGDIQKLTSAINDLLQVFNKASDDMRDDPLSNLGGTMEKITQQNEEIGRSLLLLLELNRQHLPDISRNTRVSQQMKLRKPRQLLGQ